MNLTIHFLAQGQMTYIWRNATYEGKAIILILAIFSIFAWSVMASKALQMRRAKKFNYLFYAEFHTQNAVLGIHDRRVQVEGCPLFTVYQQGCLELEARLKAGGPEGGRKRHVSLKAMEHVKRTLERAVAQESLKLESGLITLGGAGSGAPFLGLLGTVWGVMRTFGDVGQKGSADLQTMAPGVSAA